MRVFSIRFFKGKEILLRRGKGRREARFPFWCLHYAYIQKLQMPALNGKFCKLLNLLIEIWLGLLDDFRTFKMEVAGLNLNEFIAA